MNKRMHAIQIGMIIILVGLSLGPSASGLGQVEVQAGDRYSQLMVWLPVSAGNPARVGPGVDAAAAPKQADLSVTIADTPDPVYAGAVLTYTLDIQNAGPDDAVGVVLSDTLPAETSFVSSVPGTPTCSETGGEVLCQLGDMLPSTTQQVLIVVQVNSGATGPLQDRTVVYSSTQDPQSNNNDAAEVTQVDIMADLALGITDFPDPLAVSNTFTSTITYTLWITNIGPSDAINVTVVDHIPDGLTYLGSNPPVCTPNARNVHCPVGTFVGGATQQFDLMFSLNPGLSGSILNRADINTDDTPDPDLINNSATEETLLDSIKPVVSWVLPVESGGTYFVQTEVVHLEATASDNIGVEYVYFYWWDPVNGRYWEICTDYSPPYSCEFDTSVLIVNDDNQTFARATDLAGWDSLRQRILLHRMPDDAIRVHIPVVLKQ